VATATEYKLAYSNEAANQLRELDGSVRATVARKGRTLQSFPHQAGKPLTGNLSGFRRIVAAGRYRIIYRVLDGVERELDQDGDLRYLGRVEIVCLGIRKEGSTADVYYQAGRMLGN
jgi:mRNA-degrading endonuclease RelE of RelBE toxin-antitoxin system